MPLKTISCTKSEWSQFTVKIQIHTDPISPSGSFPSFPSVFAEPVFHQHTFWVFNITLSPSAFPKVFVYTSSFWTECQDSYRFLSWGRKSWWKETLQMFKIWIYFSPKRRIEHINWACTKIKLDKNWEYIPINRVQEQKCKHVCIDSMF